MLKVSFSVEFYRIYNFSTTLKKNCISTSNIKKKPYPSHFYFIGPNLLSILNYFHLKFYPKITFHKTIVMV